MLGKELEMKGETISEPLASQRLENTFASQFSPSDYKSSSTAQRQIFPHQNMTLNSFLFCSAALW